jgi:phosphoglycolate phosphatase
MTRAGSRGSGHGDHLRRVLQENGVRPGGAIVIGDERRHLEAVRAGDIPFGAVAWGDTHVEVLEAQAPAAVFAHPAGVVEKVAGPLPSDV